MVKDSFTGEEFPIHRGVHVLKNDGTIEFYGSSKSYKNALKLHRDKRKLKWTEAHTLARAQAVRSHAYAQDAATTAAAKHAEEAAAKSKPAEKSVKKTEKKVN
jgi:large subunit ribosomal protein L24e